MRNIIDRGQLEVVCSGNKPPLPVLDLFAKAVGVRVRWMFGSANEPGQTIVTADSMMGNLRDPQMTTSRGEKIWRYFHRWRAKGRRL